MNGIHFLFLYLLAASVSGKKEKHGRTVEDREVPYQRDGQATKSERREKGELVSIQRCRQNFHERTEDAFNRQINLFYQASFVYNDMAQYFSRCDVALPGFHKFFNQLADQQRENAETLQKYQTVRGGIVSLQPITTPMSTTGWGSGLEAMTHALEMEKSINAALLELHSLSVQLGDPHALGFISTKFLSSQVEKIYALSQYVSNLERAGPGLGEYLFDKLPQN